tara:strand:- start:6001 stop:6393 length:393 start_codon:yes stop_codon:yes gene_type:complete
MKILIVEDDTRFAKKIQKYLESRGHTVKHVLNGRLAINLLEEDMHDGVISDIQMPGGNGIELLQSAWRAFENPPSFYVHSSEDVLYWEQTRWDLPEVIGNAFKDFAIFRSKSIPNMPQEMQQWLDSIGET